MGPLFFSMSTTISLLIKYRVKERKESMKEAFGGFIFFLSEDIFMQTCFIFSLSLSVSIAYEIREFNRDF